MTAANRIIALDGIVDAATKTRRRDMPGRYLAAGRIVTALVAVAQGLAAVAEAIGEADEHARRRITGPTLRSVADDAWRAGFGRRGWEEHRFTEAGPAAGEHVPPDREEYLDGLEGWQG